MPFFLLFAPHTFNDICTRASASVEQVCYKSKGHSRSQIEISEEHVKTVIGSPCKTNTYFLLLGFRLATSVVISGKYRHYIISNCCVTSFLGKVTAHISPWLRSFKVNFEKLNNTPGLTYDIRHFILLFEVRIDVMKYINFDMDCHTSHTLSNKSISNCFINK